MDETASRLMLEFLVCVAGVLAALGIGWFWRQDAVGLTLAYLMSLGTNHYLGGFIHALPWYGTPETPYVALGSTQCMVATVAFCLGALAVTMMLPTRTGALATQVMHPWLDARIPETYLGIGTFLYFVVVPFTHVIPSIGAVAGCGSNLVIVGFCLGGWRAWLKRRPLQVLLWLAAACSMPIVTVLTQGFLGYGIVALLSVVAFVTAFYRPRWVVVVGSMVALYLGVTLFVNYMRERPVIRQVVWGNSPLAERITTCVALSKQCEWFDYENREHLDLIDARLNQNILVGRCVDYVGSGQAEFARGETLWSSIIALVPRIIWPDKPVGAGGRGIVSKFTGLEFAESTSVGIGHVMEFYINFGQWGVAIGFLLLGGLVRLFDVQAGTRLARGSVGGFTLWYMPALSAMNSGGSLVELTGTFASSWVLAWCICRWLVPVLGGSERPLVPETV
jgi:hypothetical protein